MAAALVASIWLTFQVRAYSEDVLIPFSNGLEQLDDQLLTAENLVEDLAGVIPPGSIENLANRVGEIGSRLESLQVYVDLASAGIDALGSVPFFQSDLEKAAGALASLETDLAGLMTRLDEVEQFLLENQAVPTSLRSGVTSALSKLRVGLDNSQNTVDAVDRSVDTWLNLARFVSTTIFLWGIAGQVGLIILGSRIRKESSHT